MRIYSIESVNEESIEKEELQEGIDFCKLNKASGGEDMAQYPSICRDSETLIISMEKYRLQSLARKFMEEIREQENKEDRNRIISRIREKMGDGVYTRDAGLSIAAENIIALFSI